MQTQKAENMIEHEAEIYARPPRTWFQTEKQKKESAKRSRPGANEEGDTRGKNPKKQKKEEGKGKKEKESKEDRGKHKPKDKLLEVCKASTIHTLMFDQLLSGLTAKPVSQLQHDLF